MIEILLIRNYWNTLELRLLSICRDFTVHIGSHVPDGLIPKPNPNPNRNMKHRSVFAVTACLALFPPAKWSTGCFCVFQRPKWPNWCAMRFNVSLIELMTGDYVRKKCISISHSHWVKSEWLLGWVRVHILHRWMGKVRVKAPLLRCLKKGL